MMTSDTLSQGTPGAQVARREFAGRGYAPLPSREERRSGAGLPFAAAENPDPPPVWGLRRCRTPSRRRFAPCGGAEPRAAAGLGFAAAENTKPAPVCPSRRCRTPIRRRFGVCGGVEPRSAAGLPLAAAQNLDPARSRRSAPSDRPLRPRRRAQGRPLRQLQRRSGVEPFGYYDITEGHLKGGRCAAQGCGWRSISTSLRRAHLRS